MSCYLYIHSGLHSSIWIIYSQGGDVFYCSTVMVTVSDHISFWEACRWGLLQLWILLAVPYRLFHWDLQLERLILCPFGVSRDRTSWQVIKEVIVKLTLPLGYTSPSNQYHTSVNNLLWLILLSTVLPDHLCSVCGGRSTCILWSFGHLEASPVPRSCSS